MTVAGGYDEDGGRGSELPRKKRVKAVKYVRGMQTRGSFKASAIAVDRWGGVLKFDVGYEKGKSASRLEEGVLTGGRETRDRPGKRKKTPFGEREKRSRKGRY